jgi:DegV family protein with EDD domain
MDSNTIAIIADSTCDIPDALVERYGIIIVPHMIFWGADQYHDRVDLQPVDFYHRLSTDSQRPTTSQASLLDFQQAYEKAAKEGAQHIVVLTVSSAMSGAFRTAQNAAEGCSIPVTAIDSKGPTMTLGWQTLAAARARDAGADLDSILRRVEQVRSKLVQYVGMDTLEYLQRGGRIGNAMKWVGTLLQVKPLVSINHQSGLVEPVWLARTHRAMKEMLYSKFFESLAGGKNLRVAVLHGNAPEEAEEMAERIRAEFDPLELIVNITGPVLGINTGPKALALCGYAEG